MRRAPLVLLSIAILVAGGLAAKGAVQRTLPPHNSAVSPAGGQTVPPLLAPFSAQNLLPGGAFRSPRSKSGSVLFEAPAYAAGSEPRSVATGDFNGDGNPDLVITD